MRLSTNEEFRAICAEILSTQKTDEEWSLVESGDWFQTESFTGGYDATEGAFCFSHYDSNRNEFWFQVTLSEVAEIAEGKLTQIEARPAE